MFIPLHNPAHQPPAQAPRLFLLDNIIGNIIPTTDLHHIYLKMGNHPKFVDQCYAIGIPFRLNPLT